MTYDGNTVPYRNAKFANEGGSIIEAEINHPIHGWIPTSISSTSGDQNLIDLFTRISVAGDAAAYTPPGPADEPLPSVISRRQFYTALYVNGTITEQEFIDVFKGFLPASLQMIVNSIPDNTQRVVATGLLLGAQEFQRGHDLVYTFQTANGWHSEDVDAFFKAASKL